MSLDDGERRRTGEELRRNRELSGLTEAEIAADLGLAPEEVRGILAMTGVADPADVWLLRDYLEQAVRDAGKEPLPFTVLTERDRPRAERWFGLRAAPRHDFGAGGFRVGARPRPGGTASLTGRTVSRIGYGAARLSRLADDRASAIALLRLAAERGVDHFDTALFYGDGLVNDLLREAFGAADGLVIASKVGADPDPHGPFPMRPAQRPEQLRASVEANLRSLGLEHLPLVSLRRLDAGVRIPVAEDQRAELDDQLAELTALRDAGLVGAIGLSGVTAEVLRRALPAGIAAVQNEYSLVARGDDDLLDLCAREGVAWVPFSPLGGALPGTRKVTEEPAVQEAARALGVTPAQLGLAWLLRRSPNVLLIPGTASAEHLEANLAAGAVEALLDEGTLAALDAV